MLNRGYPARSSRCIAGPFGSRYTRLNEHRQLVRVRCAYCNRVYNYRPDDLIEVFGEVDVDSLMPRMRSEGGADHGQLDVRAFVPTGCEAVGLRLRRLVAHKSSVSRSGGKTD